MSARRDADDLIDAVMPQKGGFAVMLYGYFDESERTTGVFAVAGFAFSRSNARRCRIEWSRLFGKYGGCHMTDLALKQGRFKGISGPEARRLIEAAIQIINERVSFGGAVSCDLAEINAVLPKWIRGFKGAYPVCCNLVMTALGLLLDEDGRKDRVAYFFEDGHEHETEANYFMSRAFDVPELRAGYRHYSHTFVSKADEVLLQTADVLAWEWAKTRKRVMRRSLAAILTKGSLEPEGFDGSRFKCTHIYGSTLLDYVERIRALGVLQLAEEQAQGGRRG